MSWSNNLLATHLLQPHSSQAWTNRSRDATIAVEQDGKLTLLVILTTSTGLAIILLLLIFVRIGCLKGKICLEERHKESQHSVSSSPTNDGAFGKGTLQPPNQTTFVHTKIEHDTSSSYTIKLIDNDLIIETQESEMLEREDRPSPLGAEQENCNSTATLRSPTDNNSSLLHEWPSPTCNNGSLILLETKSLNNSPLPHNQAACKIPNEEFKQTHQPELFHSQESKLLQSYNSYCSNVSDDERYAYTYGNQLEYCGGLFGYTDPLFTSHYSQGVESHRSLPVNSIIQ